ncbi:hypothetical protein D770_20725 [Flammeovirgaceae bacterium 311]|nr:hypothetical protein D770_20725 [Flammeovirgaceae bacterium 311]
MKIKSLLIYSLVIGSFAACSVQENDKKKNDLDDFEMETVQYEAATTSDTVMETEQMVERHFVRMPDTPQGYRAQALLEVVMAEDEEQILPFVFEHYDPDFIDQVPQSDHQRLLRHLQGQIQAAEVDSFENLDNTYRIGIISSLNNQEYLIDIYFEPEAPYKISGIRVL